MEKWDAYDRHLEKLQGLTLIRGEEASIPEGVYHLVCHTLVKHTDGTYLLMQRDPGKPYPLMWEATAVGSALCGETPYQCAVRELEEETGISAEPQEIMRSVDDDTHCIYVDHMCITGCDKDSVVLQAGETVDYRWVTRSGILSMSGEELLSRRIAEYLRGKG